MISRGKHFTKLEQRSKIEPAISVQPNSVEKMFNLKLRQFEAQQHFIRVDYSKSTKTNVSEIFQWVELNWKLQAKPKLHWI